MKNYTVLFLAIILTFTACKNGYEKEVGEVDSLMSIVSETEKSLFSVDTSRAYSAKRQIEADLKFIATMGDTLDKETAFRLDEYYSGKKKLYRFSENYDDFIRQLNFSKDQLTNLKQDLNNGKIKKDDFNKYYQTEQSSIMELNSKIHKSIDGIEVAIQKMEIDRDDILEIFEGLKQSAPTNDK